MIYHVLNGQVMHLSPSVIRSVLRNAHVISAKTEKEHFFLIAMFTDVVYDKPKESPYEQLFEEDSVSQYKIFIEWKDLLYFLIKIPSSDRIIFHSQLPAKVFFPFNLYSLLFGRKKLPNCSYVCWGGDYTFDGANKVKKLYAKVMNKAFSMYRTIVTLSSDDRQEIQRYYPNANVIYAPYLSYSNRELMLKEAHPSNYVPTVMVSHSGWTHNQHEKSFEKLKKFAGKINVVCPLCYGDNAQIENIIDTGKAIFGDKFSFFKELMPKDEYVRFIHDKVDIYVSSAEVQTGLGTIFCCVCNGIKIYVSGNNLNSLSKLGFYLNSVDDIKEESLSEFIKPYTLEIAEKNIEALRHRSDNPMVIGEWRRIYE